MEWILDDWSAGDIVSQIVNKWGISERHAKRYLADARESWSSDEDKLIEQKRRIKIESLKKLKRSLKDQYKGTPLGIRAVLAVESKIIELEQLNPATKLEVTGKNGTPIKTEAKVIHDEIDYDSLPDEVLLAIVKARKVKTSNVNSETSED
jgi:hypothetical protein